MIPTFLSQQEFSRKDAKGAKTQSPQRFVLCVFAPFASLRETVVCDMAAL
jgi:hypothetical protein